MKPIDANEPKRCPDCYSDAFFSGRVGHNVWYECHYCGKTFRDMEREKIETEDKMNNRVIISEGTGYWDLVYYPWGGSFRRTKRVGGEIEGLLKEIFTRYSDGSPATISVEIDGCKRAGFQVGHDVRIQEYATD